MSKEFLTSHLTKGKKDEIRKIVKSLMEKEGLSYDDWISEQEFQYMLSQSTVINESLTKKSATPGGNY